MNELQLHDIKGLMTIPDYSLYILIAIGTIIFVVVVLLLYFLYKILSNRKPSLQKESFKYLQNISFENPKQCAYEITYHGRIVANTKREKKLLEELISNLEQYKYKAIIPTFNEESKRLFEQFMESVDV